MGMPPWAISTASCCCSEDSFGRRPPFTATSTRRSQASDHTVTNECTLKLRKRAQQAKQQLALARAGVHMGKRPFQHSQFHLALDQFLRQLNQMPQGPRETIQAPDH